VTKDEVESPCNQTCRLDPQINLCVGCYRTAEEIVRWSRYSAAQKRAVLEKLPQRKQEHAKPA
jgi:predicted Fe-S protein YdhL (DUF1289 family)